MTKGSMETYREKIDAARARFRTESSTCFYGNGWPMINVNPVTCAGASLLLSGGGAIRENFTAVIGTETTITKELIYNGPNTDRANAWSVNTTTETVDCPCD